MIDYRKYKKERSFPLFFGSLLCNVGRKSKLLKHQLLEIPEGIGLLVAM